MTRCVPVHCHLEGLLRNQMRLPTEGDLVIRFCHRIGENRGTFTLYGGVDEACRLLADAQYTNRPLVPICIIGLESFESVCAGLERRRHGSSRLFDWAGAAYVRYGMDVETVCAIAARIAENRMQPLPVGLLLLYPEDLLKDSSAIRHWLQNRRASTSTGYDDFAAAAEVGGELGGRYLKAIDDAFSDEHRRMVGRLGSYQCEVWLSAAASALIDGLRVAIDELESAWREFEACKAELRDTRSLSADESPQLAASVAALGQVLVAVDTAIGITRTLEEAVQTKGG